MTQTLDVAAIRAQFPVLSESMRGKPLIYLDNGATSLKPEPVLQAVESYNREYSANIHRGVYELSGRATAAYDEARASLKRLIGVQEGTGEVIFTRGTTESINTVAFSWAVPNLKPGDEIVLSPMEHHANLVPWQQVARRTGAVLRYLPLSAGATIPEEAYEQVIGPRTRLVALTAMSNVTGYTPRIDRAIEVAHRHGAAVLVDAAQYASHRPVDVTALECDFLVFSGHKMCGPTGIGVLFGRMERLEEMEPFLYGGDMIDRVGLYETTWAHIPERFEAGTPNIAGAIGLGRAAEYLMAIGMDTIADHEHALYREVRARTADIPWIREFGDADPDERGGIFSFEIEGVHPHDVGSLLDQQGVAVRTGFHCAQPLMDHFGVTGTVRASFYLYNTTEEVAQFVAALERLHAILA